MTKPRQVVLGLLDYPKPQSIKDLLNRSAGQIDRASLYRTINLFEKLGIVNRVNIGFKYKVELSDTFARHHHHLSCISCGQIINIDRDQRLEKIISQLSESYGFASVVHQLEMQGLCEQCRKTLKP